MSARDSVVRAAARVVAALGIAGLVGCATPSARDTYVLAQPKTEATRTITSFSGALSCMDDLFVAHGVRGIRITSIGIPDATGQISVGTRDMLISAISQMTRRSGAFQYADWELDRNELNYLHERAEGQASLLPTYYVRGAITQLDQNIIDWRKGFGVAGADQSGIVEADAAYDTNQTASVVALDLNVGLVQSREILPGLTASNSLAVSRQGSGTEAGLTIKQVGAFFSVEMAQAEGMHYAVRTLIELGAVELLGKLAQVPYWDCLQIEGTNPAVMAEAANWYNDMKDAEKVLFVQRVLIGNGYLEGPASGRVDNATRAAIAAYQADQGMIATGRVGFDLYYSMLGSDRPLAAGPPKTFQKAKLTPDPVADQMPRREPVILTLKSVRGPQPAFAPTETLQMSVGASKNAYLYCYYQDARGHVSRIFPNRFQPDPYISGGQLVEIPGRDVPFEIRFDDPGSREEVACLGSDREVGLQLPMELKAGDLVPLPVATIDELITEFEKVDRTGLGVARMPIVVTVN